MPVRKGYKWGVYTVDPWGLTRIGSVRGKTHAAAEVNAKRKFGAAYLKFTVVVKPLETA